MTIILEPHTFELSEAEYAAEWSLSVPHSTRSFYSNSILKHVTDSDSARVRERLLSGDRRLQCRKWLKSPLFFPLFLSEFDSLASTLRLTKNKKSATFLMHYDSFSKSM